jgi:uncharacterized protein YjdB
MRLLWWLLGLLVLAILVLGALPSNADSPATKLYLPSVRHDFTPTPTQTPTPTPTPLPSVHFQYRAYVQNQAWLGWQDEDGYAGTQGIGLAMQAFQMRMTSGPSGAGIRYRAYVSNRGWLDWQSATVGGGDGGIAGDTGGNQVEAIELALTNVPSGVYVNTEPYVADWGFLGYVRDNWIAGGIGLSKRMEGFHAKTDQSPAYAQIHVGYAGYVQGSGSFQSPVHDNQTAGTTGQSLRLEQFKVALYNYPENMDIQYRCQYDGSNGWTDYGGGGTLCGVVGKAIFHIQMQLVNPYPGIVFHYAGHFANVGWRRYDSDNPNESPDVFGDNNRLEALQVAINNTQA